MERVVREESKRTVFQIADRKSGDLGIGRTRRIDQMGTVTGVHFNKILITAEGIHWHRARFQKPTAIENLIGKIVPGRAKLSGLKRAVRFHNGFGNARREQFLVSEFFRRAIRGICKWRAMSVGRGNEDTFSRDIGLFGNDFLGTIKDIPADHATIDHRNGDAGFPIIKNNRTGIERVVCRFCELWMKASAQSERPFDRGDILGSSPGPESGMG